MILLIHAAATLFMTGLVWFVQIVHYPLFAAVGEKEFARYARLHSKRATRVVAPVMLIELAAALSLAISPPAGGGYGAVITGLILLGGIWVSTAFVQVPTHSILAEGFGQDAHRRLVATNWFRTAAWTIRAAIAVWLIAERSP